MPPRRACSFWLASGARMWFFAPPMSRSVLALAALCVLFLGSPSARAQSSAAVGERRLRAVRVEQGPRVDGVLDDDIWRRIPFTSDFLQKEPEQGKPSSLRT